MAVVVREDYLFGVKFWAQWSDNVPKYRVMQYVGRIPDTGEYMFIRLHDQAIIRRSFYQLNKHGFVPFCIDTAQAKSYYDTTSSQ